jgi:glycosidase
MVPKSSPEFDDLKDEYENFNSDAPWMERAVLVAKHVPVWMAQCQKQYGIKVKNLSDIPDTEFEKLASLGYTVIWLVGLWQRSAVSKKIKRQIGLDKAEASAYAIRAYEVANEWGGLEALKLFRRRAAHHGIRLGADMVPNHTAMDADWMAEQPDLYLSSESNPYPYYSFEGADLSENPQYELFLEDHYRDQSDAAVVFKRVGAEENQVSYIYHGNDGVQTPWNDTAQLDYSNPKTRAKMIAEILRIAKNFSLLRFDAAMLLTNQHIQRLWFPIEADQSHIPSRENKVQENAQNIEANSKEFWLELIETLNKKAPDTLLLAEAYWMLENYFAHTLGLHRVYNIQFMRLLAENNNQELVQSMKHLASRDLRFLSSRANFLSNPDEESAAYTFGDGDRYFCLCTLQATMPGLPIFAHGQAEGYRERYAMDIVSPNLDENPDQKLLQEHLKRISPLLHRRDLFGPATNFKLFEFCDSEGNVIEDVICFVNGNQHEKALVLVNNSATAVVGRVVDQLDEKLGNNPGLIEALSIGKGENWNARDFPAGNSIAEKASSILKNGFHRELNAYEAQVIWEFVEDD